MAKKRGDSGVMGIALLGLAAVGGFMYWRKTQDGGGMPAYTVPDGNSNTSSTPTSSTPGTTVGSTDTSWFGVHYRSPYPLGPAAGQAFGVSAMPAGLVVTPLGGTSIPTVSYDASTTSGTPVGFGVSGYTPTFGYIR